MRVNFTVNGRPVDVDVPPMTRLLDVLREEIGLTGTKEGCGEGECGACTVTLDGVPVVSCLVPVVQVQGAAVGTVEGLGAERALAAVQEAFTHGAAQCGICTPGILVAAQAAIAATPQRLTREQIRTALAGNLCRCTGYMKIIDAVEAADAAAKPHVPSAASRKGRRA